MYPSIVEYMYNHGAHLSLIIVIAFYMITLKMPLVYYVIIVYYHFVLKIRLFMNSTCLVSFSHNMSNELLLCKYKHFKHQNKSEAIMYLSLVEYMYNHGSHLSLIIVMVFYMITLNMPLVYYVIIVYYHFVLKIRLFMKSTWYMGMVQANGLHILYWPSDHRVNIGYNYSSTWESSLF